MAVADVERVEKVEKEDKPARHEEGKPAAFALSSLLGWPGGKIAEGRAFLSEVRGELKKVTWPSRKEVYSTTLVVIGTSVFFGFYLWGLDIIFSRALSFVFRRPF
jgi:preprotein translocase subunit SecE